jgi:hypothetical protein
MSKTNILISEVDSMEVASWSPGWEGEEVPPTQVHVVLKVRGSNTPLVMRLKSRRATDELIAALVEHRDYVWPDQGATPDRGSEVAG